MDLLAFLETWRTSTIALQEPEKGRLIDALAELSINSNSSNNSAPKNLCGREKVVYPFLHDWIVSKTAIERTM